MPTTCVLGPEASTDGAEAWIPEVLGLLIPKSQGVSAAVLAEGELSTHQLCPVVHLWTALRGVGTKQAVPSRNETGVLGSIVKTRDTEYVKVFRHKENG